MNCPDFEYVEDYISGRLNESELVEFEAHLKECSKCNSEVTEAQENESMLSELRQLHTKSSLVSSDKATHMQKIETVERAQELLGSDYLGRW